MIFIRVPPLLQVLKYEYFHETLVDVAFFCKYSLHTNLFLGFEIQIDVSFAESADRNVADSLISAHQ